MPKHPWWVAFESSDTTEYEAKMSDLCDPSLVVDFLVKLMEINVAIPYVFRSFGVMAVWQYFLFHDENPVLNEKAQRDDEAHLYDIHNY